MTKSTHAQLGRLSLPGVVDVYASPTGGLRLAGVVEQGHGLDRAIHMRRQIASLAAEDTERVVPIVVNGGGWRGFAQVRSASVDSLNNEAGQLRWELEAAPVRGSALPVIEQIVNGADRANLHGITREDPNPSERPTPCVAVPRAARAWDWSRQGLHEATYIDTENGEVEVRAGFVSSVIPPTGQEPRIYSGVSSFLLDPEAWYIGAASVTEQVGSQWLPTITPGALRNPWRLSNGIVRTWVDEGSTELFVQWYTADTGWSEPVAFSYAFVPWWGAVVTDVRPESTTVHVTGGDSFQWHAWLTVRRGSPFVDVVIRRMGEDVFSVLERFGFAQPRTVVDGGAALTTDLGDGFTGMIAHAAYEQDPGSPHRLRPQDHTMRAAVFGIGATRSPGLLLPTFGDPWHPWFAAMAERMVVGVRL